MSIFLHLHSFRQLYIVETETVSEVNYDMWSDVISHSVYLCAFLTMVL